nr:uncharacterized protein LOC106686378 isoform X2 [Halyomorpha halys]
MPAPCQYCKKAGPCKEEPKVTYSSVFGPSIDEIIVCLLFLLAYKLCEKLGIAHDSSMKENQEGNSMNSWLSKEIKGLAVQLSMLGYDLSEPGHCLPTPSMVKGRKFVLNKLAEIMEKKDELEGSNACSRSSSTMDSLCS